MVKWRNNNDTQISNNKKDAAINFTKAALKIKEELIGRGFYNKVHRSFNTYVLKTIMMHFYQTVEECKEDVYKQVLKNLSELFHEAGEEPFLNKYSVFQAKDFLGIHFSKHAELEIYNEYKYMFKYEWDKILKIKELADLDESKIVLWGYGKNGQKFVKECKKNNLKLDYIIDKELGEKEQDVFLPKEISDKKCVIMVVSTALVGDIVSELHMYRGNFKVVDVQAYMTYGLSLKDCIFGI